MRVLLDESLPRPWKRELPGLDVVHVADLGWAGLKNGELLRRAAAEKFAALVTADRNMEFQQNLPHAGLGVVIVYAITNRLQDLRLLSAHLIRSLDGIQPGELRRVGAPDQL